MNPSQSGCKLTLVIRGGETDKAYKVEVSESFEECMEHLIPLNPPNGAMQSRETCMYTVHDTGKRMFIAPNTVGIIEEL